MKDDTNLINKSFTDLTKILSVKSALIRGIIFNKYYEEVIIWDE